MFLAKDYIKKNLNNKGIFSNIQTNKISNKTLDSLFNNKSLKIVRKERIILICVFFIEKN